MRPILDPRVPALLLAGAATAACGSNKTDPPPPAPTGSASASAVAPSPDLPRGPFSVVLEARAPIVFSGLDGGVVVADAARAHFARAAADAELRDGPMPSGLPEGKGRIVRAAGRLPASVWLSFEKQRDDGKAEASPLYRFQREGWKQLADDWTPAIAAWSKNRILAASTSSGRLKIKIIEPSLPKPPDDLPSPHLADAACEKTLAVVDLAALRSGDVFAAGTCKPDIAAGAGASAKRSVVLRWPAAAAIHDDGGAPDAGATAEDAGAEPVSNGSNGPPALVDVLPGVSVALTHQALVVRSAVDAYVAAIEETGKAPPVARLFHFDGTTWGVEPLPDGTTAVRGLAGTSDGALWLATDHAVWKRPAAAAPWEAVPLPGAGTWDVTSLHVVGEHDVWLAARRTGSEGARDLVLRTRPARNVLRWE